jgi:hypothetical protein
VVVWHHSLLRAYADSRKKDAVAALSNSTKHGVT